MVNASTEEEIDKAFAVLARERTDALIIASDPFLAAVRAEQIATLATRNAMPTAFNSRDALAVGGLISYGPATTESYRQAGIYTARILKGEKPADLPVVRSTKFEMAINLNTARALGIKIPTTLLAQADEVIE